jgi:hypothetical protein
MNARRLVIPASMVALMGLSLGTASAGEVKGPPGTLDNTNYTAAPANANSNCAYSGLNDFDTSDPVGQFDSFVQTAADAFKFYGLPHGFPGTACRGGSNEDRAK